MHNIFVTDNGDKDKSEISGSIRLIVIVFGLILLVAGSIGTFKHNNAVGFTTLIVLGSFALLTAGIGRWPNKLTVGGGGEEFSNALANTTQAYEAFKENPSLENAASLQGAHLVMQSFYKSIK